MATIPEGTGGQGRAGLFDGTDGLSRSGLADGSSRPLVCPRAMRVSRPSRASLAMVPGSRSGTISLILRDHRRTKGFSRDIQGTRSSISRDPSAVEDTTRRCRDNRRRHKRHPCWPSRRCGRCVAERGAAALDDALLVTLAGEALAERRPGGPSVCSRGMSRPIVPGNTSSNTRGTKH